MGCVPDRIVSIKKVVTTCLVCRPDYPSYAAFYEEDLAQDIQKIMDEGLNVIPTPAR
jgi:hypothetical protein